METYDIASREVPVGSLLSSSHSDLVPFPMQEPPSSDKRVAASHWKKHRDSLRKTIQHVLFRDSNRLTGLVVGAESNEDTGMIRAVGVSPPGAASLAEWTRSTLVQHWSSPQLELGSCAPDIPQDSDIIKGRLTEIHLANSDKSLVLLDLPLYEGILCTKVPRYTPSGDERIPSNELFFKRIIKKTKYLVIPPVQDIKVDDIKDWPDDRPFQPEPCRGEFKVVEWWNHEQRDQVFEAIGDHVKDYLASMSSTNVAGPKYLGIGYTDPRSQECSQAYPVGMPLPRLPEQQIKDRIKDCVRGHVDNLFPFLGRDSVTVRLYKLPQNPEGDKLCEVRKKEGDSKNKKQKKILEAAGCHQHMRGKWLVPTEAQKFVYVPPDLEYLIGKDQFLEPADDFAYPPEALFVVDITFQCQPGDAFFNGKDLIGSMPSKKDATVFDLWAYMTGAETWKNAFIHFICI
eukprot:gb/GECG01008587.1/.p1 GENE.gb/GECG01008587.1/~~gb/GECG01008587.1/.p1  ORF type:complete len:457 (+),score=39.58 gb/GECG01008587.1/:1-1371(+)